MQSIKNINNNSLKWKNVYVDTDEIVTRDFSSIENTIHYKFIHNFFSVGAQAALQTDGFGKVNVKSHSDLFSNIPRDLKQDPLWWLMPWGGVIRHPKLDLETRQQMKQVYGNRFIKLLSSVEKQGLLMNDFCPPVHQLKYNSKSCYILQDGHHRTAIYAYLKKNFPSKILNNSNNLCKKLTVSPQLIIHRECIPRMRLCSYINKKPHFCLTDAYKWFDLSFKILDIKIESLPYEVTMLSRIHDKLVNK